MLADLPFHRLSPIDFHGQEKFFDFSHHQSRAFVFGIQKTRRVKRGIRVSFEKVIIGDNEASFAIFFKEIDSGYECGACWFFCAVKIDFIRHFIQIDFLVVSPFFDAACRSFFVNDIRIDPIASFEGNWKSSVRGQSEIYFCFQQAFLCFQLQGYGALPTVASTGKILKNICIEISHVE
ncbi:MAG: hypothetical protein EOP06_14010 [Proteobacteria bacterium]|nr:MAG: hypothetical protein EOP06_14010 [Pseudomonadota bacterium]